MKEGKLTKVKEECPLAKKTSPEANLSAAVKTTKDKKRLELQRQEYND